MKSSEIAALTVAGLDPSGGAGIVADALTLASIGVRPCAVVTALTVQDTRGVYEVMPVPASLIREQIMKILDDVEIRAIKIGMLYSRENIVAISSVLESKEAPLVLDPLIKAGDGTPLLEKGAERELVRLVEQAQVVTPNVNEAEALAGIKIRTLKDCMKAAEIIAKMGPEAVVVKGGHLEGKRVVDLVYYKGRVLQLETERISGKFHGTGCVFSSAIAGYLALGLDLLRAIREAKRLITLSIKHSIKLGRGRLLPNPLSVLEIDAYKYRVLENLNTAVTILERSPELAEMIPEVRINIAYAMPRRYACSLEDVAAIPGRITKIKGRLKATAQPMFGASKHLARAVLAVMEYDPTMRAAMNIKYDPEIIRIAKELGFTVSFYDRRKEPPEVKRKEGTTIPWGIRQAIKAIGGKVPDLVYHLGDWGKEPMITIFGRDAVDAVLKALRIARRYRLSKNV